MRPAIRVENLGKSYRVNHAEERLPYKTLRDSLTRVATAPVRRWRAGGHYGVVEQFWALSDVSFDVEPGEVVGIIGRNGAGKSTLLKILSRITSPTTGRVTIRGRVGSLLEVGTGFHPELTGRENIYMNGSILGMSRAEIKSKFDEIVDFSGVEKFLDTPVKRYSSGMQVRLAFAVAANLEPEVLIVDEVLAVGDAEFQKKCLGKMQDVAAGGRTVLLVSHNMAAIQNLASRVMVVDSGHLKYAGDVDKGIRDYLTGYRQTESHDLSELRRASSFQPVIRHIEFQNESGDAVTGIPAGDAFRIVITYRHSEPLRSPHFGITFENQLGIRIIWVQTRLQDSSFPDLPSAGQVVCEIPSLPLIPGRYFLTLGCGSGNNQLDWIERACAIEIGPSDYFGTGRLPTERHALVLLDATWSVANGEMLYEANGSGINCR